MKYIFTCLILSFYLSSTAQTSVYTEISSRARPSDHYLLKHGKARIVTVTIVNNPKKDDKYVDQWKYEFKENNRILATLNRNSELLARKEFELDSLGRRISMKENFKHKALGWQRKDSKIIYSDHKKEIQFLNEQREKQYTMIVEYDSVKSPIRITSFNSQNEFDGLSTADYDYENNRFVYKIYKADMSIVLNQPRSFILNYVLQRNEFNDIIEMYWPTSEKSANVRHVIEYKYDKKGNWIRQKRTLIMPGRTKVLSIITRKIKYEN
jgi:hypothetical protein